MAKQIKTVKCPLCGWHHSIIRTGIMRLQRGESADRPKGKFLFLSNKPNELTFISVRECRGRGKGLPQVESITLGQAKNDPEYNELIESLRFQAFKILEFLTQEK